ncbi:MAG: ABC transporter permease [bacterium]|nr:ABC transporter permease [bacterium]
MNLRKSKNFQLLAGVWVLGLLLASMVFFALWKGVDVSLNMEAGNLPPSWENLLGTDSMGRDYLSCIIYGTGISLTVGITAALSAAFAGVLLGMIAGWAGGITDQIIMRMADIVLAFPGILAAMVLVTLFRGGILYLILLLTICGWPSYAGLIRGEVLKYKKQPFILAARSYNASSFHILIHHFPPLLLPLVAVRLSLGTAGVILTESGLNFLGLGLGEDTPTLGNLLDIAGDYVFEAPRLLLVPGLVLFLIIISFNFIGEGLRKHFTK